MGLAHRDHWDDARASPIKTTRYTAFVPTVAELRYLVLKAREDPHVIHCRYERSADLAGAEPGHCPRGHPLGGGSASRAGRAPADCVACPGHIILTCRFPISGSKTCGLRILDP